MENLKDRRSTGRLEDKVVIHVKNHIENDKWKQKWKENSMIWQATTLKKITIQMAETSNSADSNDKHNNQNSLQPSNTSL